MKKLSLIIAAVICCIFYSCNTDCPEITLSQGSQNLPSDTSLIKNLEFYNKTLKTGYSTTRGNWGGRLWAIVAVDAGSAISAYKGCVGIAAAITAVSGGTAGPAAALGVWAATAFIAGGSSYATHLGTKGCSITKSTDDFFKLTYQDATISKNLQTIYSKDKDATYSEGKIQIKNDSMYSYLGQVHNDILKTLLAKQKTTRATGLTGVKDGGLTLPVKPQFVWKNSYGLTLYKDSEIKEIAQTTMVKDIAPMYNEQNYNKMLSGFKEQNYISEQEFKILLLFYDALKSNAQTPSEMNSISDYYKSEIKKSIIISTEEKQKLLICIEIAKYSFKFWYEQGIRN